mmetsp:Transcript_22246/g.44753  ORF Transcript_22246/g.44753 Transcript_22246/m.44753 type:complete len:88 (+) Transcript_22246:55-318(+)
MRQRNLAKALVNMVLDDVCLQTRSGKAGWGVDNLGSMMSFVTLPHCMQTSAKFWARLGFELGTAVDSKESKQASLMSWAHLSPITIS